MSNSKLSLSFTKYSDDGLETKAEGILSLMTGNSYFPAPVPPLADLQVALTAYQTSIVEAVTSDKIKIANKRSCRIELETVLVQLGRYVMFVANGNELMLISTGFDLVKQPEPKVLEEPGLVTVSNGISSGRLVVSIKRVKGAYSYLYQITPDPLLPNSTWTSMPLNRSTGIFENLVPGQKYWIRVAAVGAGTQIAYTQETWHIAL
jgi:hypothetical protein